MPSTRTKKKSKKSKQPKKSILDEIEESLLLAEDPADISSSSKPRKPSLETSLLEEDLLAEEPTIVKKSSKRRRTRNSVSANKVVESVTSSSDLVTSSELDISLNVPGQSGDQDKLVKELETKLKETKKKKESQKTDVLQQIVKKPKISKPGSEIVEEPEPEPKIVEVLKKFEALKNTETEEVDIYSDLSGDNIDNTQPEGCSEEVTIDEVFKMNSASEQSKPEPNTSKTDNVLSEPEVDDLDYEDEDEKEESQMRISVLGGGQKDKKSASKNGSKVEVTKPAARALPPAAPVLPPLPHNHITIPPMLPLPPVLPHPARYHLPAFPAPRRAEKRTIYINPKFKTEVILKNLEEQGILKGGNVAVHMNRNRIRSRSRSPIKLHSNFEYVPSPKHNLKCELDDPTTTLLLTDLSVCTTKSRIRELFSTIGSVKEVLTYPTERRAVVTFDHAKDAVVCRRKFHRSVVDGSCMTVNFAV